MSGPAASAMSRARPHQRGYADPAAPDELPAATEATDSRLALELDDLGEQDPANRQPDRDGNQERRHVSTTHVPTAIPRPRRSGRTESNASAYARSGPTSAPSSISTRARTVAA